MRTWNDYKKHVKEVDPEMGYEISKIEKNTEIISAIISAIIKPRKKTSADDFVEG